MSVVEEIINDLQKDISNSNIEIKEKDDAIVSQKEVDKKIDTLKKKSSELLERYEKGSIDEKTAKARVRKYQSTLRKLEKQATGQSKPNMNKVGKAQPRPANSNPNNVRCFMRYNNQGNIYRVCDSGGKNQDKPIAQITKPISVNEFLNKIGKSYGELTDGQAREYHRLDMANRRFQERADKEIYQETYDSVLQEQRRAGGLLSQRNKLEEQKAINNFKLELAERTEKMKKELNLTKSGVKFVDKKVKVKYGLSDKAISRLRKKYDISEDIKIGKNISKEKIKQSQIKTKTLIKSNQGDIKSVGQNLNELEDELIKVNKSIEAKEKKASKSGKDFDLSDPIMGQQIQLQAEIAKVRATAKKLNKDFKKVVVESEISKKGEMSFD